MSRCTWAAVAISILLHSAILLLPPKINAVQKEEPLQIELRETVVPPTKTKSSHAGRGKSGNGIPKGVPTGALGPHLKVNEGALNGTNLKDAGNLGLEDWEWGARGASLAEVEFLNKYDRLYQEIDNMLNYPFRLGYHGLSDVVNVRLTFDRQSHCDWNKTRIGGTHPYFRYYVLALLKKLCALSNLERLAFQEHQSVDLSFNFLLVQELTGFTAPSGGINGNVIRLYRTYPKPKLEYNIGPIRGFFPIPAVTVDFEWIQEHWEQYVDGRDPLIEFQHHSDDRDLSFKN